MPKVIKGQIRVLQLIHGSGITGPGKCVYTLAKYFDRKKFSVDVLCPKDGCMSDNLRNIDIRVMPLELGRLWMPGHILRILKILRKEGYHIFHVHSGQLNAFSKIIGKLLGVPAIIITEHLCAHNHVWIKNKAALLIHMIFHRFSNLMTDRVIAVSDSAKDAFAERQHINSGKLVTVYNGIDLDEVENHRADNKAVRELLGIPQDAAVVGMVGRFSREKGQEIFVLAAKEVLKRDKDIRFLAVGEGPERCSIEKLAEKLGIKNNLIFAGFCSDIYSYIGVMDIVVQPSLDEGESLGLSVIEAMAKGKPVIASNIECFREFVKDGENGLFFTSQDYLELSDKIIFLLKDAKLRNKLGISARESVWKNFDGRNMADKTAKVYKETLLRKGFSIAEDLLEELTADFTDNVKKERNMQDENLKLLRDVVRNYLVFIRDRNLTQVEAAAYLDKENNFLIDMFLQFLERHKPRENDIQAFNNRLFRAELKKKKVTLKDYDERIKMQPLQFQIDNYYLPKDEVQRRRIDIILSALLPDNGERILDVGCGVGSLAYHCARCGADAVGIDYSPESINTARLLTGRFSLKGKATFACCDAAKRLPYADSYFDKIVAADFIEHIDDAEKKASLSEMVRVLKPGGTIVVFTPNALREKIGSLKSGLLRLSGAYVSETRLHYGLTNRFRFERMLSNMNLVFIRRFFDINRPYLAKMPLLNEFLSLNMLWVIKKKQ